jgi:Tol biopolymer transport system component
MTDVFVRDLTAGTTSRVSVSSAGAEANGRSSFAAITPDGRYVVFCSSASNLVTGDTNGRSDVFVRDRQSGTTVRASLGTGGVQGNLDAVTGTVAISADGRYVAFPSDATNLVAADTNAVTDVFIRDLVAGTTTRVSLSSFGEQGNGASSEPSLSRDGQIVAYSSLASNLVADDFNRVRDIFVYELVSGITSRASVSSTGFEGSDNSSGPVLSADGRYVAFGSLSVNFVMPDGNAGDQLGVGPDIFVRDRTAATTSIASVTTGGFFAPGQHRNAAMSADGRYIAFESTGLLSGSDTNNFEDIYLRDRDAPPPPPAARIDTPATGAEAFGTQALAATVLPGFTASRVDFLVDGAVVASDTTAPYTASWNTTAVADGPHNIVARAVGANGADSSPVSVSVINQEACDRKIEADFAAGIINVDDYVRFTVYCAFEARLLDARHTATSLPREVSDSYMAAMTHWGELSSATQAEITQFVTDLRAGFYATQEGTFAATKKPTVAQTSAGTVECVDVGGYRGLLTRRCTYETADGVFKFNFSPAGFQGGIPMTDTTPANGIPDKIDRIETSLREARLNYTSALGFRTPSFQIQVNLRGYFLGLPPAGGGVVPPPGTPAASEIFLDPSAGDGYVPRHEMFHVIEWQYISALDYNRLGTAWWAEASAEWAVHKASATLSPPENAFYASQLEDFLDEPHANLDVYELNDGRRYGAFILAEFLEERFGTNVIRSTWERIEQPDGLGATEAIDAVIRSNGIAGGLGAELPEFWHRVYRLAASDFPSEPSSELVLWRQQLEQSSLTAGDATNASARPARLRVPLIGGRTVSGSVSVSRGGASFVDLVNPTGRPAVIALRVSNHLRAPFGIPLGKSDEAMHVSVLVHGAYPAECAPPLHLSLSGGVATANISLGGSCTFATLVATNDAPVAGSDRVLRFEAQLGAGARPGDVLVARESGMVSVFRPDGAPVANWFTGATGYETGMAFDTSGNLYVTNFGSSTVSKLAPDGTLLGNFGSGYSLRPESIIFDSQGDAYVGQAEGAADVQKRSAAGAPIEAFDVAIDDRGSDWIQLRPDGCTLVYTSEGTRILQYDVCTRTQLPDFAITTQPRLYGIALLPDGGAVVAGESVIRRYDSTGTQTRTYDDPAANDWFSIALDPDGTSFWATDGVDSTVYRFDLATGAVIASFPSGARPGTRSLGDFPVGGVIVVPNSGLVPSAYLPPLDDRPPPSGGGGEARGTTSHEPPGGNS